ncbi:unnamed protein product, partial [Porites lobata]
GLNWDLVIGTISITDRRICKFIALIDKFLLSAPYVAARDCAVIAGHVMSMSPVLESRRSWDSRFNIGLHNDCLSEIFFWKNNIVSLNTRPILPYNAPLLFSYSDASNVACGAFVVGSNEVSHRMWTACEAAKSPTWRELKAIQFALSAFKASVRGKCVKWHSDSQGAVRVVEIGSPSAELHSIALDIFYFCRTYNITLIPQWVPRELNACADAISHIVDFDDWYTTPEFFAHLDRLWGPHTVSLLKDALQPNFQQVEDGRLRALVQDLPAVLLKSKADSTARNLIQESASCSTIDEVHYGLKWVHDLAGLPDPSDSEEFIFRPLVFLRSTGAYKLRGSVPLSYTREREIVLSAFDSIGLPKQDYGLHSLRAGGASAAANARVPDRLFKRHGRWKSDKAKDGYIKDSVHSLLSVSLSLGI